MASSGCNCLNAMTTRLRERAHASSLFDMVAYAKRFEDALLRIWEQTGKTILFITHGIDEAVYLGQRVAVLTSRPGRIKQIIDVPFGYPRDESLQERAEFVALRSHIRELVMSEYRAQQALAQPASFSE